MCVGRGVLIQGQSGATPLDAEIQSTAILVTSCTRGGELAGFQGRGDAAHQHSKANQ